MKKDVSRWLAPFCACLFAAGHAASQTITLTAPLTPVDFEAGDEFSHDEVGSPWQMNQLRDIPFDYNFQQPTISEGIWRATNSTVGAAFYPLFKGYSQPTYTNYPSYYTGGMPYGPLNPIDCSKYDRLSIRMGLPQSARSSFWIAWTADPNRVENGADGPCLGFVDGDYLWDGNYQMNANGFRIYDIGFTRDAFFRERVSVIEPCFTLKGGPQPWDGTNFGFFIQATLEGAVGTPYEVDWIRLYDSSSSPVLRVAWNTSGISTNYSGAIDHKYSIQLWLDNDSSGYDGDLFMTGLINDGSYDLHTAALPPGDYYIYLKAVERGPTSYETLATSGYSARIRILAPPDLDFTAPSYTSGVDYASSVLGNPWDMSDEGDIDMSLTANISLWYFLDGLFCAYANPPLPGQTESDAQLMLNTKSGGQYAPIDTSVFRYLTYRIAVDPTGYVNINDRVARGWVTRCICGKTMLNVDGTESQPIPILEGWHDYTLDLWDPGLQETDNPYPAQLGWKNSGAVNWLRFDPLEVPQYTLFYIDDIKLCAQNTPVNGLYTISWVAYDDDSDELTINLYYGTLSGGNFSGRAIATVTQAPGRGSYTWNASGVSDGSYYIKAVVSDGSNVVSRISRVPVVVEGRYAATQLAGGEPAVGDFDGDGIDDVAVFKESSGYWVVLFSDTSVFSTAKFGDFGYIPAPTDFDGDGKADLVVYCDSGDWPGYWYVLQSRDFSICYAKWGTTRYLPVPGDYDGDGTADLAVYCAADDWPGYWYVFMSSNFSISYAKFGATGYAPAPADFDGDGKTDLAVYCEATGDWPGYWYVFMSSDFSIACMKFGAAGYVPVPADYDGDGKADVAVYCESGDWPGYWYIWLSASSSMYYMPFGTTGYVAAPGDYDGDGISDLGVYNPASGNWYAMSLAGKILVWIE